MNEQDIHKPHDIYFKNVLSKPEVFRDFLTGFFPEQAKGLNLSSLRVRASGYTDKRLKEYFSDLVYEASTISGQKLKITLLLEHKSYPTADVNFQILRYILNLWDDDLKQSGKRSGILPILIYTGEQFWKPENIRNIFKRQGLEEEFLRYQPDFDVLFLSVVELSDQMLMSLTKNAHVFFWLYFMKYVHKNPDDFINALNQFAQYIKRMFAARDIEEALIIGLQYLSYFRSFDKPEVKNRLMEVLEHITPSPNSLYMEFVRKGEEIGFKKGERIGFEKGERIGVRKAKLETAYKLYKIGMSVEEISLIVELSKDEIIRFISEKGK